MQFILTISLAQFLQKIPTTEASFILHIIFVLLFSSLIILQTFYGLAFIYLNLKNPNKLPQLQIRIPLFQLNFLLTFSLESYISHILLICFVWNSNVVQSCPFMPTVQKCDVFSKNGLISRQFVLWELTFSQTASRASNGNHNPSRIMRKPKITMLLP